MADKFALYIPNLGGGGAQRVVLNLAKGFIRQGFEVDIVAANTSGPLREDIPDDANLIDLGSKGVLRSMPRLVSYIKREKPAAMLSAIAHSNVVVLIARQLSGIKMRLVVREASTWAHQENRAHSFRERAVLFLMKRFYSKADLIVANSTGTAADLIKHGIADRDNIRVIHNPIFSDNLIEKQKENVDHPWFQDNQIPVVLGMGRLHPIKDFETLIRSFHIVRRTMAARLVILGEGTEKKGLLEIAAELGLEKDIDLPGFVINPHAYISRSSIFVLSSKWEGFGNVLVEALAAGTPVVSTDCGGPAEILDNGKHGRLVPVGDATSLAEAITETLEDPPDRNRLIERSYDFSIENISSQYISALEIG